MSLSFSALLLVAVASVAAGVVNTLAGGGTLIAFPALTIVGVPTVEANITTTVALTPGYAGGAFAQRDDLAGQRVRLVRLAGASAAGGLGGALLLLRTDEDLFRAIVPWLIFAACGLLAAQDVIRRWVARRAANRVDPHPSGVGPIAVLSIFLAGLYGGYFGAGLGIVLLGVLGAVLDDGLPRLNALKQSLAFLVNIAASALLILSGRLPWDAAAVMAIGSLAGGSAGGRIAGRIDPRVFRAVVLVVGLAVGFAYLLLA